MSFLDNPLPVRTGARAAIAAAFRMDEAAALASLLPVARADPGAARRIAERAAALVVGVRATRQAFGGMEAFLKEYGLSTKEGVALMCLAEALLRIPDDETADLLIEEKIGGADWEAHVGRGDSLFVNASTWALMLTGRVVRLDDEMKRPRPVLGRLVKRMGEPVIREAMRQAMRILGRQFVMGRTVAEALERAEGREARRYRYSYDMLGEAARTAADADRYLDAYARAIDAIGAASAGRGPVEGPGISVKLSALFPRLEPARAEEAVKALTGRLRDLAIRARGHGIGLLVDAEESDRLDLSLDIVEAVFADRALGDWGGFGFAVQAYQKRAIHVIAWAGELARAHPRRLTVRLVKGAYWDTEIKRAQELGLPGYPVFTRKVATDVSYLACARRLLAMRERIYPQFATHNAQTVASVLEHAGGTGGLEFQRLHGMGEPLYDQIVSPQTPVRVYAPVGSHEDLLAYLVRRLLENGANTSFVNRLQDDEVAVEAIVADPAMRAAGLAAVPHPRIPLPADLFRPARANSAGLDLGDPLALRPVLEAMEAAAAGPWRAGPIIAGEEPLGPARPAFDPAHRSRRIGEVAEATAEDAARALAAAAAGWGSWRDRPAAERAEVLERAAGLLEGERAAFMAAAVREGGKTLPDAVAEVREAADFCRYYAAEARARLAEVPLPGPTGERNTLALVGRGVFVCISPWNFPLAIFMGQVTAALAAGNAVIAKPAEQTPLIAAMAVRLLHRAGVPPEVLCLLPGDGAALGRVLLADPRVAGVAFTGSTETARAINGMLAARPGPIVPLIAETGGQNAMVVDSTALPEQVVQDAIDSAFRSAGQRCSALRVLFVAEGIADRVLEMLAGAAATLLVGDPERLATDVGPVIDEEARQGLQAHARRMDREGRLLFTVPLSPGTGEGTFFAPRAFEIDRLDRLTGEVFGPILHVIRYHPSALDRVLDAIAATGYGLTLGIHSRIQRTAEVIHERLSVGNTYVNRNMIGAVVGVQPFGGHGLSGTGPKAGGPHYLPRFAAEKTLTINTTAAGGNTELVSLSEDG